jgi:hypothetical protein
VLKFKDLLSLVPRFHEVSLKKGAITLDARHTKLLKRSTGCKRVIPSIPHIPNLQLIRLEKEIIFLYQTKPVFQRSMTIFPSPCTTNQYW